MVKLDNVDTIECDLQKENDRGVKRRFWKCKTKHDPELDGNFEEVEFYAQGFDVDNTSRGFRSNVDGRWNKEYSDLSFIPGTSDSWARCYHKDGVTGELEKRQKLICQTK